MAFGGLNNNVESKEARALGTIDSQKYPDTNKDLQKNIARLNASQDYMAQYMRLMQKGIDEANQNAIEQIQALIANLIVLFAGGTPTGIDLGDLQYILPAIGALFGFGDGPFPVNLLNAAQHFFLGYVVPLPQFTDVITDSIIAWATEFGLSEDAVAALNEFFDAVTDLGMDISDLITKIFGIFDIFGILGVGADMGPLGDLFETLFDLFGIVDAAILGPVIDAISVISVPVINQLTNVVEAVDAIVEALGMSLEDIGSIGTFFDNFWEFFDLIDFSAPDFDLGDAVVQFVTNILNPAGLLATLTGGLLSGSVIPQLDASKITTGMFDQSRINGLPDALANAGGAIADAIVQALGGSGTGHDAGDVLAALGAIPGGNLVGSIASSLLSGTLAGSLIPQLDASKIGSGTINLSFLPTAVNDAIADATAAKSGVFSMFSTWFPSASPPATADEAAQQTVAAIKAAVAGGFTLQTFTASNAAWAVPPELANATEIYAGVFGGGGRGATGQAIRVASSGAGTRGLGGAKGIDGGFIIEKIDPSLLESTLNITVGAAAATPNTTGAVTRIASGATTLAQSTPGAEGISSPQGYLRTSSKPGSGGVGGDVLSDQSAFPGTAGESSAKGPGGTAGASATGSGTGNAGGPGGAGVTNATPLSGGGGGGGGGGRMAPSDFATVTGGPGGNGGFPGGGSGGGGAAATRNVGGSTTGGVPGTPAHGLGFLLWR